MAEAGLEGGGGAGGDAAAGAQVGPSDQRGLREASQRRRFSRGVSCLHETIGCTRFGSCGLWGLAAGSGGCSWQRAWQTVRILWDASEQVARSSDGRHPQRWVVAVAGVSSAGLPSCRFHSIARAGGIVMEH